MPDVWLDSVGHGRRDPAEPPLPGVAILVDAVANGFAAVGRPARTAAAGPAALFVASVGCPRAEFAVHAVPPSGTG